MFHNETYARKRSENLNRLDHDLIAASIPVSKTLAQLEGKPSPALDAAIADAISLAERILQRIDSRSASPPKQQMTSNENYPWKTCGSSREVRSANHR